MTLREIAKRGFQADLSTAIKDEREPFIVLSKFRDSEQNDGQALNNANKIFKHFFFSFIILMYEDNQVDLLTTLENVAFTSIPMDAKAYASVASASLETWVNVIKKYSTLEAEHDVLKVLNEIQDYFEIKGLSFLFKGSNKKSQRIGYTLE